MFSRRGVAPFVRRLSSMSSTPIEDAMRVKLTESLSPSTFEVHNDSHLHAHHQAMKGSTSTETHFRLVLTSDAFRFKTQPARHRMIYAILKDELQLEGGIHALQLRTRTPEEEAVQKSQTGQSTGP